MAVTEGQVISDGTAVWKVKKIGNGELPVGTMQMFAGNTIPAGWLLCDGSAVSRTNYAKLFSAIGTIYGDGDGSTTFALPDLIDRFVQGAATAGTYKAAGLPNISGSLTKQSNGWGMSYGDSNNSYPINNGALYTGNYKGRWGSGDSSSYFNGIDVFFDASKSNTIYGASATVQPPALTMLPIIKY